MDEDRSNLRAANSAEVVQSPADAHTIAETIAWLDKYVKNAPPRAKTTTAAKSREGGTPGHPG